MSNEAAAVAEGAALAGLVVAWKLPMTAVEVAQHALPVRALPDGAPPVQRLLDLAPAAAAPEPLSIGSATVAEMLLAVHGSHHTLSSALVAGEQLTCPLYTVAAS